MIEITEKSLCFSQFFVNNCYNVKNIIQGGIAVKITSEQFKQERIHLSIGKHLKEQGFEIDFDNQLIKNKQDVLNFLLIPFPFEKHKPSIITQIKERQIEGKIIFEQVYEYMEQFEHDELTHVDYIESDEVVTFSDVLMMVVYLVSEVPISELEYADHVSCNNCATNSIYVKAGAEKCPVCQVDGTLSWFEEKFKI
jgi:hypothetical protein